MARGKTKEIRQYVKIRGKDAYKLNPKLGKALADELLAEILAKHKNRGGQGS
jgi:hypothetical protein